MFVIQNKVERLFPSHCVLSISFGVQFHCMKSRQFNGFYTFTYTFSLWIQYISLRKISSQKEWGGNEESLHLTDAQLHTREAKKHLNFCLKNCKTWSLDNLGICAKFFCNFCFTSERTMFEHLISFLFKFFTHRFSSTVIVLILSMWKSVCVFDWMIWKWYSVTKILDGIFHSQLLFSTTKLMIGF